MSDLGLLVTAWDEAYREFAIALGGLPDAELWKRPHPRLLSVGELAGHIAYWQAVWVFGGGDDRPDLTALPVQSLLLDHGFRYYTLSVDAAVTLDMGTAAVLEDVAQIHALALRAVAGKGADDAYAGQWQTWGNLVQYQVFHVAYHTGQVYSVRHLLGHETEDN